MKDLDAEEVEPAVSLILGQAFPKWSRKTLDVSWELSGILQRITDAGWNVFHEAFARTGDVGASAEAVFETANVKRQTLLLNEALTILEVRRLLDSISSATGVGAREKKERLITTLLSQATPVEVKYLVKIFIGEMRTGLHEGLMEQAVARAFDVPLATVQKASMTLGDIAEVAAMEKPELSSIS